MRAQGWAWASCAVMSWSALCSLGCARGIQTEEQQETAQEFARLNLALAALQRADNRDKTAALRRFASTGCQRLCAFRAACLAGFEQHVAAVNELGALRARLDDPSSDAADVAQRMLGVERTLASAQPLLVDCSRAQGELRRRFQR